MKERRHDTGRSSEGGEVSKQDPPRFLSNYTELLTRLHLILRNVEGPPRTVYPYFKPPPTPRSGVIKALQQCDWSPSPPRTSSPDPARHDNTKTIIWLSSTSFHLVPSRTDSRRRYSSALSDKTEYFEQLSNLFSLLSLNKSLNNTTSPDLCPRERNIPYAAASGAATTYSASTITSSNTISIIITNVTLLGIS